MSSAFKNPATKAFIDWLGPGQVLAQVLIEKVGTAFHLRHVTDRGASDLKLLNLSQLRALVQETVQGNFRPLKSAPNLQPGWKFVAENVASLELAINALYPGAIPDWYAARNSQAPVTDYRPFVNRQTGMYRITQMLSDTQASNVIHSCCEARFCLKRRHWTVESLAPDAADQKSEIPCLEPCAILLEFARKAMRIEQADKMNIEISVDDGQTIREALENALKTMQPREADFADPLNPRRVKLVLEKLNALPSPKPTEK